MKKILLILLVMILLGAGALTWIFLGPATAFDGKTHSLYISSVAPTRKAVIDSVYKNKLIKYHFAFEWLANRMSYWKSIKPGKYDIKQGSSLLSIIRLLRNGQQTPVHLVITKLRTNEDFARVIGRKLETDSAEMIGFLNSADSLQSFGVSPELAMTMVLPDTYTCFWNTDARAIYKRLADETEKFWTEERKQKAALLGLTTNQVYIMASIVEEETRADAEKSNIASVYINRIHKGMPLQADPTIKFALKDFGLRRILFEHLKTESLYNTYINKGLPPGPICTPSKITIDAVLNAPQSNYLYFVASSDFNGTHVFTESYNQHLQKAKEYQKALTVLEKERKLKAQAKDSMEQLLKTPILIKK